MVIGLYVCCMLLVCNLIKNCQLILITIIPCSYFYFIPNIVILLVALLLPAGKSSGSCQTRH